MICVAILVSITTGCKVQTQNNVIAEPITRQEFDEAHKHYKDYTLVRDTTIVDRPTKQRIEHIIRKAMGEFGDQIDIFNIGRIKETGEYITDGYDVTGGMMRNLLTNNLRLISTRNLWERYRRYFADSFYAYSKQKVWAGQNWSCDVDNYAHILFFTHDGKDFHLIGEYQDSTWTSNVFEPNDEVFFWGNNNTLYVKGTRYVHKKNKSKKTINEPQSVYYKLTLQNIELRKAETDERSL